MKYLAVLAFLAVAAAVEEPIPIVRQAFDVNPDGSYEHSFESGNGIKAEQHGVIKNAGQKDAETQEVTGSFEYASPDGAKYTVHYVANENGYQPQGDHLPVAPEVPAYIQRALDWIAAHPQPEEGVKGKKF